MFLLACDLFIGRQDEKMGTPFDNFPVESLSGQKYHKKPRKILLGKIMLSPPAVIEIGIFAL